MGRGVRWCQTAGGVATGEGCGQKAGQGQGWGRRWGHVEGSHQSGWELGLGILFLFVH